LTRRDLTGLFVKFFGVIVLLSAVIPLPIQIYALVSTLHGLHQNSLVFGEVKSGYTWLTIELIGTSLFVPLAVKATAGLGLIWWSGRIADKVSLTPGKDQIVEAPDLRNIEVALVAVLGLYFIADGLAELFRWSLSLVFRFLANGSLLVAWEENIPFLVETLVKLTIGILLLLGRGGSVAMRHRAHSWVRQWRTWPD